MQLIVEELPSGCVRAALVGRMDIEGALSVDEQMGPLSHLQRKLIIDLSGVTFLASMGLRSLMMAARSQAAAGGRATLASPQPNVAKVLTTSGIGDALGVYPSVAEAVAALQA